MSTNVAKKLPFFKQVSDVLIPENNWDAAKTIPLLLQKALVKVTTDLGLNTETEPIAIEIPKDSMHGDYATNIAFSLAKKANKNPHILAEDITKKLNELPELQKWIAKVELAGPGFINFFVGTEFLIENLENILKSPESFGKNSLLSGKRIMFEYAHPNPFKVFHIGHLRNIVLGESLIRILEQNGAEVIRTNYQGDVGMHVAKSIWGMIKLMSERDISVEDIKDLKVGERVKFLGEAYATGASAFKDDPGAEAEIKDINYIVYAVAQQNEMDKYDWQPEVKYADFIKSDKYTLDQIGELWKLGVTWSLEYFRKHIYERLYSTFKREYLESETQYYTEKYIKEAIEKGVLELSQGAYILNGEKYGVDTRVFINSLGLPTYEGKQVGLVAPMEFNDFGDIDLLIFNVAVEQISYFQTTIKAIELIWPETKGRQYHNAYEFVGLKRGKMSSRTGNVVTAEEILDSAREKILDVIKDRETFDEEEKQSVAEIISIGAVKYSFLNVSPYSYLAFDINESLSFEGNSGPYLQYTYARANKIISEGKYDPQTPLTFDTKEELELLHALATFPETIIESAKNLSPNLICNYLFSLAQTFNSFYKNVPILVEEDSHKRNSRIALTKATAGVIANGLNLLGIKTVARM